MTTTLATAPVKDTTDSGRVCVGAAHRLLAPALPPKEVSDAGRVSVGAAHRLLPIPSRA